METFTVLVSATFWFLTAMYVNVAAEILLSQFRVSKDTRLPIVYSSQSAPSLIACSSMCLTDPGSCVSVNYHSGEKECQLSIYEVVSAGISSTGWTAAGIGETLAGANSITSTSAGLLDNNSALDGQVNTWVWVHAYQPWWKLTFDTPVRITKVDIDNTALTDVTEPTSPCREDHLYVITVDTELCGELRHSCLDKMSIICPRVLVGRDVKVQIPVGQYYLFLAEVYIS